MATRKKAKAKKAKTRKKKAAVRTPARGRSARKAPRRKAATKGRKARPKKGAPKAKRRKKSGVEAKARSGVKTAKKAKAPKRAAPARASTPGITPSALRAVSPAMQTAQPVNTPMERPIGTVTHYYSELSVAIVRLDSGSLREGDTVRIKGHTSDFTQPVESMEIDHLRVDQAYPGQAVGLRVREHARENDVVYKVED